MNYMIIYKKPNGNLVYRPLRLRPSYKIGDKNSYNWTIIDILKLYKGKCYSKQDYDMKISRQRKIRKFVNLLSDTTLLKIFEIISIYFLLINNILK